MIYGLEEFTLSYFDCLVGSSDLQHIGEGVGSMYPIQLHNRESQILLSSALVTSLKMHVATTLQSTSNWQTKTQ